MQTDALLDRLASDGVAAQTTGLWRWALPLVAASLAGLLPLALILGPPLDALGAIGAAPYAMKLGFTLAITLAGAGALHAASNPGSPMRIRLALLALPFAAVLGLAGMELLAAAPQWPGASWQRCLTAIALLTPACFAAAIFAARRLAPTRLALTGAVAGLFAGGAAASAYALWCPETDAVFLLSWYALPIAVAGAVGALIGPRFLRW